VSFALLYGVQALAMSDRLVLSGKSMRVTVVAVGPGRVAALPRSNAARARLAPMATGRLDCGPPGYHGSK
jgi:hypothetical protein